MDVERMALQVRRAGEVDVRGGAANKARATWRSATTAIRDLQRDWQHWSAAERVCDRPRAGYGQQASRWQFSLTPICFDGRESLACTPPRP